MWKKLDISDLRKILSEDEVQKLSTISISTTDFEQTVNDVLDVVSDTWRGMLLGKSVAIDIREHYTPSSLAYWILIQARYTLWTRFPNSPDIALDAARQKEYEKSLEIFDSNKIGTEAPEWEYSSNNPDNKTEAESKQDSGSIRIPYFSRFDDDVIFNYPNLSAYQ